MRRIAFLLFIVILAGCKSTPGPFAAKQKEKNPDPLLTSEEKQPWNRQRLADPDENRNLPPQGLNGYPTER